MPKIQTMSLLGSIHTLIIVSRQLNWRPTPFDYIKWTSFLNLDNCLNLKKMVSTKDDEMRFWSAAAASATADASVKWMNYYSKTLRQPPASYLEINKRAFVSYARYITFASPTPFTTLNYIDFYLIRWLSYSFIFDVGIYRRRRSVALCDFYRIVVERSDIKQLLKKLPHFANRLKCLNAAGVLYILCLILRVKDDRKPIFQNIPWQSWHFRYLFKHFARPRRVHFKALHPETLHPEIKLRNKKIAKWIFDARLKCQNENQRCILSTSARYSADENQSMASAKKKFRIKLLCVSRVQR